LQWHILKYVTAIILSQDAHHNIFSKGCLKKATEMSFLRPNPGLIQSLSVKPGLNDFLRQYLFKIMWQITSIMYDLSAWHPILPCFLSITEIFHEC